MKKDDLAELLLACLYDKAEMAGHNFFFFQLDDVAAPLGVSDQGELLEAVSLLEERGLALLSLSGAGEISAMITAEGCVFVEGESGSGILARYREDPGSFRAPGDDAGEEMPDYGRVALGREIYDKCLLIRDLVEGDRSMEAAAKGLIGVLDNLNLQLGAKRKNRGLLSGLLDELERGLPGRDETAELRRLVEEYLR